MSSHFMIWNAQGIANTTTQGTFKNMIDMYSILFAAVLEPQTDPQPSFFNRRFGLQFRCSNTNGKIWIFSHRDWQVEVIDDSEQVLHVRVSAAIFPFSIYLSVVYAKCSREGRYDLWNKLRDISLATDGAPWLVGGDFNIFLLEEERQGSTTDRHGEMMDFADAVADCQLLDPGFDGPPFTWTRSGLWERLDRVFLGEHWTTVHLDEEWAPIPFGWERYYDDPEMLQFHKRSTVHLISLPRDFNKFKSIHMYDIVVKNRNEFEVRDT
ncbi:uncharacterized protein LOC121748030 [Salvia splendens]|uniref:uncharacterized protein LOC121748030 n=1 Tax=Salvia splendens TaxID=180675 RepID=UPI001C27C765|nr:uncharacterized protein LOC121748030 [Salvia splendens]